MRAAFDIRAEWDDDARVWTVTESDIPGLVAEAPTVDELYAKLRLLAPELMRLNRHLLPDDDRGGVDFPIHLMVERLETIRHA